MTVIDVHTLLAPVSDAQPCGEPLEDSQAFFALENAAQFREGGALGGDGTEPDWVDVKRQALALASEGKDIRVAVHLTAALLRTDGWAGFAAGLALLQGYLEQHWDHVYPLVEDDDPFFRVNALFNLSDSERFINALRRTPVVQSRMAGSFALRDYLAAAAASRSAAAEDEDTEPDSVDPHLIRAAFAEADAERLAADIESIEAAMQAFDAIQRVANENLGSDAPDLSPMGKVLQQIRGWIDSARSADGVEAPAESVDGTDAPATAGPHGLPAAINSPEQAIQALDMVSDYFRRREPSSPVPLLLERAKRLVRMDFLALMRDLAPDGLSQAQRIFGVRDDD